MPIVSDYSITLIYITSLTKLFTKPYLDSPGLKTVTIPQFLV
jgi:hypothetical protein